MSADLIATPPANDDERLNRELIELLNELRVALPGVQVLFAFLLIVPFQARFVNISDLDRALYFVAFLAATAAAVIFIAPSTYHRIRYTHRDKASLILYGNRMLIAGTVFLSVSMVTVGFLLADVLYGNGIAAAATALIAAWLVWFWYGVPLTRAWRARRRGRPG